MTFISVKAILPVVTMVKMVIIRTRLLGQHPGLSNGATASVTLRRSLKHRLIRSGYPGRIKRCINRLRRAFLTYRVSYGPALVLIIPLLVSLLFPASIIVMGFAAETGVTGPPLMPTERKRKKQKDQPNDRTTPISIIHPALF